MSKLVVFESITLDGVMQAPGRPDDDRRGGFEHGGWAAPYADPALGRMATEGAAAGTVLLFGRRTYEDFYRVWPSAPQPNPVTAVLNNARKYVVSRTLEEPLPWQNSALLRGDLPEVLPELKAKLDSDLLVLGSGELVQTLIQHDLVDRYVLLIHPLVLGSGRRLFREGGPVVRLRLLDTQTTSTGVVIATYEPE